jgi:hypothetical protein
MQTLVVSRRFRFGEVQSFILNPIDDPSKWKPDALDVPTPKVIESKWVYVFQVPKNDGTEPQPGTAATLFRACFVEAQDQIHIFTADQARSGSKLDVSSVPAVDAVPGLPDFVFTDPPVPGQPQQQFFYYFVAARIQLGPKALSKLEGQISNFLPPINLPDDTHDFPAFSFVPVVDAVTITENFFDDFAQACDTVIDLTMALDEMDQTVSTASKARAARLLLGHFLKNLLQKGAKDLGVSAGEAAAVISKADRLIQAAAEDVATAEQSRRNAGLRLTQWLQAPFLWILVDEWYQEDEIANYHQHIFDVACAIERMLEEPITRAYLANFDKNNAFMFGNYIERPTTIDKERLKVVLKAPGSIVAIKEKLVPFIVGNTSASGGAKIVTAINNAAGTDLLQETSLGEASLVTRAMTGLKVVSAQLDGIVVNVKAAAQAVEFDNFVNKAGKSVKVLTRLTKTTNLVMGINKLGIPKNVDALIADLKFTKDLGKAARSAFEPVTEMKALTRAVAGTVVGVLETALAIDDGLNARNEGDWGRFTGDFVKAVGGSLAIYSAIFEAGISAGVFGVAAAAVTVVGTAIVAFMSDTDFESFVSHCSFGSRGDPPVDDFQPKWSPTNVKTWTNDFGGLQRQLDALSALCANFALQATGPSSARIFLGDVRPESRLIVGVDSWFTGFGPNDVEFVPTFTIIPTNGVVVGQTSVDHLTFDISGSVLPDGRFVVDVSITPDPPQNVSAPPPRALSTTFTARLDVNGDGNVMVPIDKPMSCLTFLTPSTFDTFFRTSG